MTLDFLIVVSGIVLSASLIAILMAFWPSPRSRHLLCLKAQRDTECERSCIRTCHLATLSSASSTGASSHAGIA